MVIDKQPLLMNQEDYDDGDSRDDLLHHRLLMSPPPILSPVEYTSLAPVTAPPGSINTSDQILGPPPATSSLTRIFVCSFDAIRGNEVVWSLPNAHGLDGVDFRVIPSGAHNESYDLVYTRTSLGEFVISVLYRRNDQSDKAQRGSIVRSCSLASKSLFTLSPHIDWLAQQAERLTLDPSTEPLEEYFKKYKTKDTSEDSHQPWKSVQLPSSLEVIMPTTTSLISFLRHGGLYSMFRHLEKDLFRVWRAVMLRQRLMIMDAPPVTRLAASVFASCQLGAHSSVGWEHVRPIDPLFYVSVGDIDSLPETCYIACSTDLIYGIKTKSWDLLIVNRNELKIGDIGDTDQFSPLGPSASDAAMFKSLSEVVEASKKIDIDESEASVEYSLARYFSCLNTRVVNHLLTLNDTYTGTLLDSTTLKPIGFGSAVDVSFFNDLASLMSLEVRFQVPSGCCT